MLTFDWDRIRSDPDYAMRAFIDQLAEELNTGFFRQDTFVSPHGDRVQFGLVSNYGLSEQALSNVDFQGLYARFLEHHYPGFVLTRAELVFGNLNLSIWFEPDLEDLEQAYLAKVDVTSDYAKYHMKFHRLTEKQYRYWYMYNVINCGGVKKDPALCDYLNQVRPDNGEALVSAVADWVRQQYP